MEIRFGMGLYPSLDPAARGEMPGQRGAGAHVRIAHARAPFEVVPGSRAEGELQMSSGRERAVIVETRRRMRFSRRRSALGAIYELVSEEVPEKVLQLHVAGQEPAAVEPADREDFMRSCTELMGIDLMRRAGEVLAHLCGPIELSRLAQEERLALVVWSSDAVLPLLRSAAAEPPSGAAALRMRWFVRLLAAALDAMPPQWACYCDP